VRLWLPTLRLEAVQVAVPPLTGWALQPLIEDPPSLKSTLPVGPEPVTVPVNVTDCPNVEGLSEDPRAVVVATWLTVCISGEEVLPWLSVSPP
jgi:hypothetical protein